MALNVNDFRSFVLSRNPSMTKNQLGQLDIFVKQKGEEESALDLARQGQISIDELIKYNPTLAQRAINEGITKPQTQIDPLSLIMQMAGGQAAGQNIMGATVSSTEPTATSNPLQIAFQTAYASTKDLKQRNEVADAYKKVTGKELFGEEKSTEKSGEVRKLEGLGSSGLRSIQTVREIYVKDPDILTKQLIPGKFVSRTFDSALFNAVDALLRIRTGAQAPEKEIRRYMSSLGPTFGDDPKTVEFKLKQLEQALAESTGVPIEEKTKKTKLATENRQFSFGDLLAGRQPSRTIAAPQNNQNILDDIIPRPPPAMAVEGQVQPTSQSSLSGIPKFLYDLLLKGPVEYTQKATTGQLAQQKKPLSGTDILSTIAGPAGLAVTRPDVFRENIGPAADITGLLLGAGAAKKGISKFVSPKAIGQARTQAGSKLGKVSTEKVLQAGDDFIKKNPLAKDVWEEIRGSIGKKMSVNDLVDRMSSVWGQAYTRTGDVRSTAQASLMNKLYQAGKEIIKKEAPEVAKYTSRLKFLYTAPKTLQKATWLGLKGSAIGKLLGFY